MKVISIKEAKEVFIIWYVMCSPPRNSLWIHFHCLRRFTKWFPSILSLCIHPHTPTLHLFSPTPPAPNHTDTKTNTNALGDIDRVPRQFLLLWKFPSLCDSLSNSYNSSSFKHGPSRDSCSLPEGTLVFSYWSLFWVTYSSVSFLEDCCLITLRSHSTPPGSHYRTEASLWVT